MTISQPQSLSASVRVLPISEYHKDVNQSEKVFLSASFWQKLLDSRPNVSGQSLVALSITVDGPSLPKAVRSLNRSIAVWASKSTVEQEERSGGNEDQFGLLTEAVSPSYDPLIAPNFQDVLVVSPSLGTRLGLRTTVSSSVSDLAKSQTTKVTIRRHVPIPLSAVYLSASTEVDYELAQASHDFLLEELDGIIARQGDSFRPSFGAGAFRVIMTEPTLQGVVSKDKTQILLTLDTDGDDQEPELDRIISSASSQLEGALSIGDSEMDEEEEDDISIDERFLAQSVLEEFSSDDGAASAWEWRGRARDAVDGMRKRVLGANMNQDAWSEHEAAQKGDSSSREEVDEESAILLSEKGFLSLGAFNGDWAVAHFAGQEQSRVVRLFCLPTNALSTSTEALLPPMLLQNLHSPETFDPTLDAVSGLFLRPLDLNSIPRPDIASSPLVQSCPLPLPFADSLTIARVAGPMSVDRAYQGLFLEALRTYFEGKRRICKENDVIAVAIEGDKVRFVRKASEQEASNEGSQDDVSELRLPSARRSIKTAIVYFRIKHLTSELGAPLEVKHQLPEAALALLRRSQLGELGCVVDPDVTKMVQTGVERCRVSDAARWLDIVSDTPDRPQGSGDGDNQLSPLTGPSSPYATILSLLKATLMPSAKSFDLHLSILLKGARGCGKGTVARWVAQAAGVQIIEIDCFDLISDTDTRTEGILRARFDKTADCAPTILMLKNIEALARKSQALETGQEPPMATILQDCLEGLKKATSEMDAKAGMPLPVAVFGSTSDAEKCPTGVLGCFKHEVQFDAPNEAERLQILNSALDGVALGPDVDVKGLATQTAALVAADLVDLVSRAKLASVGRLKLERKSDSCWSDADIVTAGLILTGSDFDKALNKARSSYSESIGAPKIPNVTWDDVGGLASVKNDILDTIQLPLEHPELFSDGLKKRSGILLYGPPGTGKTLLAKAVATSCSLNFFSVKGPELLNMYIGESEANVRRVFQRARDAKPCVIFFDELDSVAPKRGNQGDSGGVMDRIVSQLLAELDGMAGGSEGTDVFVIGATNRPDLLDPALLRPGRFDRMLYLSVSETHEAQLNILQALTRKFKLDPDVEDLSVIADQCPFNLTGADFYALCSDAMLKAMTRKASEVDEIIAGLNSQAGPPPHEHPHPLTPQYYLAELARPEEIEVRVSRKDFEAALAELVPSVSEQEMAHYREVQAKFSSPKDDPSTKEQESLGGTRPDEEQRPLLTQPGEFHKCTEEGDKDGSPSTLGKTMGTDVKGYQYQPWQQGGSNTSTDQPSSNGSDQRALASSDGNANGLHLEGDQDEDEVSREAATRLAKRNGKARVIE
ncbi:AAA-domain-containing protein [Violaceomyces palustris]|uniref:AAA-domain-containing protein n=1 Tax=Violaceomyces palustris TaxID=1673888 RepID=A0ACD0NYM5_9BASI|nr:AAA-domain-containing protein [Violaceomyces palustris]